MAKKKLNLDQEQALELARAQIVKKKGKGYLINYANIEVGKVPATSSGILSLDLALGTGGWPQGRIIEFFGQESSNKTTLAYMAIAESQKATNKRALLIDAEYVFDPVYASERLGIDLSKLDVISPDGGEEALDTANMLVKTGAYGIVVLDSSAALSPEQEFTGSISDNHMGLQARMFSQGLRTLNNTIGKTKTTFIIISQMRNKIVLFGNPNTTTGGNAPKFYSSIRIELSAKVEKVAETNTYPEYYDVTAIIKKNKIGNPPGIKIEFPVRFQYGPDKLLDVIKLGIKTNVIEQHGAWYSYKDFRAQGEHKFKEYLKENKELYEEIKNKIIENYRCF